MSGGPDQDALVYKQLYPYNLYKWYMNKQLIFIVSFLLQITKSSIVNEFQIMEPKYLKESLLLRTEFTKSITSLGLDRKFMVLSLLTKNYLKLFQELS